MNFSTVSSFKSPALWMTKVSPHNFYRKSVTVSIKNPRSTSVVRRQHNLKVIIPIIPDRSVQELSHSLCAGTILCCIAAKFK